MYTFTVFDQFGAAWVTSAGSSATAPAPVMLDRKGVLITNLSSSVPLYIRLSSFSQATGPGTDASTTVFSYRIEPLATLSVSVSANVRISFVAASTISVEAREYK